MSDSELAAPNGCATRDDLYWHALSQSWVCANCWDNDLDSDDIDRDSRDTLAALIELRHNKEITK